MTIHSFPTRRPTTSPPPVSPTLVWQSHTVELHNATGCVLIARHDIGKLCAVLIEVRGGGEPFAAISLTDDLSVHWADRDSIVICNGAYASGQTVCLELGEIGDVIGELGDGRA